MKTKIFVLFISFVLLCSSPVLAQHHNGGNTSQNNVTDPGDLSEEVIHYLAKIEKTKWSAESSLLKFTKRIEASNEGEYEKERLLASGRRYIDFVYILLKNAQSSLEGNPEEVTFQRLYIAVENLELAQRAIGEFGLIGNVSELQSAMSNLMTSL